MPEVKAIDVRAFKGSDVTADGQHGLFKFQVGNDEVTLAIPHSILMPLMAALSHESGRSAQIRGQDNKLKHVFPCEWWEFSVDQSNQHLILSFRLPGGLEMSFQVALDRIPMMLETLETIQGSASTDQQSGSARH